MDLVQEPTIGYRVKAEYKAGSKNVLTNHPARPESYLLSPVYASVNLPSFQSAFTEAMNRQGFPGKHTPGTN